jgi:hypothetical protein
MTQQPEPTREIDMTALLQDDPVEPDEVTPVAIEDA